VCNVITIVLCISGIAGSVLTRLKKSNYIVVLKNSHRPWWFKVEGAIVLTGKVYN